MIFLVFLFTLVFHTNFNKCWIFDFCILSISFKHIQWLPCVYILYCVLNAIRYQMLSTMNMSIIVGWNIFFIRLVRYYKLKLMLRWLWVELGLCMYWTINGAGFIFGRVLLVTALKLDKYSFRKLCFEIYQLILKIMNKF